MERDRETDGEITGFHSALHERGASSMRYPQAKIIRRSHAGPRRVTTGRQLTYGKVKMRTRSVVGICSVAAILAMPALTAGTAWGANGGLPGTGDMTFNPAGDAEGNHCVTSEGRDANEVLSVSEQLLAQGTGLDCGPVSAGEFYIPIGGAMWFVNTSFEEVPADYTPAAPTPVEDFLAKAKSMTYVIDSGTPKEKTYSYRAGGIAVVHAESEFFPASGPDTPIFMFLAKLPPLPPGDHTYTTIIEMSARHCDGLGTSEFNCLEAGRTTFCEELPFTVVPRTAAKP